MSSLYNNGFNTTQGSLYLIAEKSLDVLQIQFVPPEILIDRKPNISEIQVVGRNTSQYQYLGGATEIPLELDFYADDALAQSVAEKCRWLESLCVSQRFTEPPERVKLVFGKLFSTEMWIVKSCRIKYNLFDKQQGYMPKQGYVSLVLAHDPKNNLQASDLRNYGNRR